MARFLFCDSNVVIHSAYHSLKVSRHVESKAYDYPGKFHDMQESLVCCCAAGMIQFSIVLCVIKP